MNLRLRPPHRVYLVKEGPRKLMILRGPAADFADRWRKTSKSDSKGTKGAENSEPLILRVPSVNPTGTG
jgi:hypothetical protein